MKLLKTLALLSLVPASSFAQTTQDYAVQLTASVQTAPPQIKLQWKRIPFGTPTYSVYRKAKTAAGWGSPVATLTAADSTYTDNAVIVDSGYEYRVLASAGSVNAGGYIYAGIKAPAIHHRGTMVLLVDSTFTDSCATELTRLMNDLTGDGWQLVRHDVARSRKDTFVKRLIMTEYSIQPNVKAILIVGHVAVPYSGDINPDGHTEHKGAWPADIYYSSFSTDWSDGFVNNPSSAYPLNQNIPGDGKWDPSIISAYTELQISRIDFYNMPAFAATEVQLMRSYLNKDHIYKMDSLPVRRRALINDNFGAFSGEAFAANGWRNFPQFVSRDSVAAAPFISSLASSSYLWAYGCGAGSFTSASGVGTTTDFTTNPVNGIFTMLFGSYFGDWNGQNNFLRAPLCSPVPALTSCWAGRPNWFFHHMVLGEHIGYAAHITQNNDGRYTPTALAAGWVHVALMGDLSLRTDYIKPPSGIVITKPANDGAIVNWVTSPDPAVIGYYVYRADSAYGYYKRLSGMLTTTTYHDTLGVNGKKYYMVRPVKLQATPSGAYYNLGVGITDTGTISFPPNSVLPVAGNSGTVSIYPNPAQYQLTVSIETQMEEQLWLSVTDVAGHVVKMASRVAVPGSNQYQVDVSDLPTGVYTLTVAGDGRVVSRPWVKL